MIDCEGCWSNPQKMQHKTATNILSYGECVSSTLQASVFMGNNHSEKLHSIRKTGKHLTMKQMFGISETLILGQSDEIYGVKTIDWENSTWKCVYLIGYEQVISLSHENVSVFSDSVLCFGKVNENPQANSAWENRLTWFKSSWQYRALHAIDGEPMEFEWNISHDLPHCSSATQSKSLCSKWAKNQKNLQDGSSSCRCSTTSHGDLKTMNRNAN